MMETVNHRTNATGHSPELMVKFLTRRCDDVELILIIVGGVNSDRSQRFATAEVNYELFGTCIFKPRPRPSGLRRSDPDRDLTFSFQSKSQ